MLSASEKKERDRLERLQRIEDIILPFPVDTLMRVVNGELGKQWEEYYPFILEHIKKKQDGERK